MAGVTVSGDIESDVLKAVGHRRVNRSKLLRESAEVFTLSVGWRRTVNQVAVIGRNQLQLIYCWTVGSAKNRCLAAMSVNLPHKSL